MSVSNLGSDFGRMTINEYDSGSVEKPWMDDEAIGDFEHITSRKDTVISGFLSIGKKDGLELEEGGQHDTGFRFVRFMLRKFWHDRSSGLRDYSDIFERTLKAFSAAESISGDSSLAPRAYIDPTITGWYKHSVVRLIGNVSKEFNYNGPFTEILVNSAKTSEGSESCFPFHASVMVNRESAQSRWEDLKSLKSMPGTTAYPLFYSSKLIKPQTFTEIYRKKNLKEPGPNSSRLLGALEYLSLKRMKAQTTGNCWMKQNKRSVLVSLFLETVTHRPELKYDQAWSLSKKLYKKWKLFTYQELGSMMDKGGVTLEFEKIARKKILNGVE